jgi:asparagine synthase (glutamine-hydrolysing)
MCGITGFLNRGPQGLTEGRLRQMNDCLAHRGPDADGFFYDGRVGLGHRRLSILDLSAAANQPMHSHDGRYLIIFNGEVYNFQEVQRELNLTTHTTSDTEVILEAYVRLGPAFVQRLNGMFAIAIYDQQTGALELFRDRMGVKPIYYYCDANFFAFASELKSLVAVPEIQRQLTLDHVAVAQFLHLGYVPRPRSIYAQIHKMNSGTQLSVTATDLREAPYWRLADQLSITPLADEEQAKAQLKELLTSSVRYRMIADVPFGTFLSGGIDSSVVTAIAQQLSPTPVRTFSIGFESARHNEAEYAAAVAQHLGTKHHRFTVTEREAQASIADLTTIYDEPFADSSAVPTLMVSKLAREHVTMTLSGDGGDELFLGYGAYQWARRLAQPGAQLLRQPARLALQQLGNRARRVSHLLDERGHAGLRSHLFSQEQYLFSGQEVTRLLRAHPQAAEFALPETLPSPVGRHLNAAEQQALFDLTYYLQDDLLVKVDRATMRHSLEARVPLLDYRLVEFALNLSPALKMHQDGAKYLLKQVLYDYVPAALFDRPKQGFSIPLGTWLRGPLRYLLDEYTSEAAVRQAGLIEYEPVRQLRQRFEKGEDYLYNRLWLLIVLHQWAAAHKVTA